MELLLTSEKYNNLPSLYANVGKWVSGELSLRNSFYAGSGDSRKFTMFNDQLSVENNDWGDLIGAVVGDTLTIKFKNLSASPGNAVGIKTFTRTILHVAGDTIILSSALTAPYNNKTFPTNGEVTGMAIQNNKEPQQIDFTFNLKTDTSNSLQSVIDTELNRFSYNAVADMNVSDVVSMVQLGNKSGGIISNVQLTRLADSSFVANDVATISYNNYKITYKFLQWGLLQSGQTIPSYYSGDGGLQPLFQIKTYSVAGNPNGTGTIQNENTDSNVGYFNENYNGGVTGYQFVSLDMFDFGGYSIDQPDYSNFFTFEAVLNTANQLNGTSKYRIGMAFLPVNDDLYKNLSTSEANNLLLNAPDVDFLHSASPDPTNYVGNTNSDGAGFDFDNLQFSHTANVLTVTGKIIPKAASKAFFDELADGERRLVIWVQVSNHATSGVLNDEVNVLIYDGDCFDAPTIGVQIPNVLTQVLYDHIGEDVTSITFPNVTTEDDMLYVMRMRLPEDELYDGITVGISARDTVADQSFDLESQFISFENVPFIGGIYQLNETINRGFFLPPSTDRNIIKIELDPTGDTTGYYGIKITYGFLLRWEYWLPQIGVDDDFFDLTESNNGKNKDWQHYFQDDWRINVDVYTSKKGVQDYNHLEMLVRPYEDDVTVGCTSAITAEDGSNPDNFKNNELHNYLTTFTWNQSFNDEWVTMRAENKEGAVVGFMSSFLDQGNVIGNALKPIDGETKIKLVNGGTTLTAELQVDTNVISSNEISISHRVFSNPRDHIGTLITMKGEADLAFSIYKISTDNVYNGPCMRIRRSSDNTETDINFIGGIVNVAVINFFVGAGNGFVTVFYNQAGTGNHLTQTVQADQPQIASAGTVMVSTDNGLPIVNYAGVNQFMNLSTPLNNKASLLQTWVFQKTSGNTAISIASAVDDQTIKSDSINRLITGIGATPLDIGGYTNSDVRLTSLQHKTNEDTTAFINGFAVDVPVTYADTVKTFDKYGYDGTTYSNEEFQELVLFNSDKDSTIDEIHANIMSRYGL